MRAGVALLVALLLPMATAQAQEMKVAAHESKILVRLPHLEGLMPTYQYFGWSAQGSVDTAYAGVAREASPTSRGQVYLHETSPLTYWRTGSALDAAWVKALFPFFKNRDITVVVPAQPSGPFARSAVFEDSGVRCLAFELRHVSNDVGSPTAEQRQSVSGIYCPPAGVMLDAALIQQVYEGNYVRRDGRIERALRGVSKPIPQEVLRTGQQQG